MQNKTLDVFKNSETESHLKRVQQYTEKLIYLHNERMSMNLEKPYMEAIVNASIMHDIGKAGVPERILYKEGPLTEHERTIIETHPLIGAYIFEKFSETIIDDNVKINFNIAKNIIKYHHEKWDGTGYPEGLKKKKIPFEARIISVVDTYDALTSKRCYKEPWSNEKALGFIKEKRGKFFDPDIVDTFVSMKNDLK